MWLFSGTSCTSSGSAGAERGTLGVFTELPSCGALDACTGKDVGKYEYSKYAH